MEFQLDIKIHPNNIADIMKKHDLTEDQVQEAIKASLDNIKDLLENYLSDEINGYKPSQNTIAKGFWDHVDNNY